MAAALRWERPDLTAALADHALWQARVDGDHDGWLAAAGWAVHARSAIGDGRDVAVSLLAELNRWGEAPLDRAAAHRLRVELAVVAVDAGDLGAARSLLGPVPLDTARAELRADAFCALARCAVEDMPDQVDPALRGADAAWAAAGPGTAAPGASVIALVEAAARRRCGRTEAALAAATDGLARLAGEQRADLSAAHRPLAAALAVERIAALLDDRRIDDARRACREHRSLLAGRARPSRQAALLRFVIDRVLAPVQVEQGSLGELEHAAREAARSNSPGLEARCRTALGALHQAAGRPGAAQEQLDLAARAERVDHQRATRLRAALTSAPWVRTETVSTPDPPTAPSGTPGRAGADVTGTVGVTGGTAIGAEAAAGVLPAGHCDVARDGGPDAGEAADGAEGDEAGVDAPRDEWPPAETAVAGAEVRSAGGGVPLDGGLAVDDGAAWSRVPSGSGDVTEASGDLPRGDGSLPTARGPAEVDRWPPPSAPGGVGECVVLIDIARRGRRFAGKRAGAVVRGVSERLTDRLPPGAHLRHQEPDALAVVLPGWGHLPATRWMHRTLPGLLEGFETRDDLPGTHLRAAVHDADGLVGAQILQSLDRPPVRPRTPPAIRPGEGQGATGAESGDAGRVGDGRPVGPTAARGGAEPAGDRAAAEHAGDRAAAQPAGGTPGGGREARVERPAAEGRAAEGREGRHEAAGGTPFRIDGVDVRPGSGGRRHRPEHEVPAGREYPTGPAAGEAPPYRSAPGAGAAQGPPVAGETPAYRSEPEVGAAQGPPVAGETPPYRSGPKVAAGQEPPAGPEPEGEPSPGRRARPVSAEGLGIADLLAQALAAYRRI